jgi:hypothetical protein
MNGELHVAMDKTGFLAVFLLKGERHARLIGTVRAEAESQHENLSWNDEQARDRVMRIDVKRVNWFSTYCVPSGRRSFPQGLCVLFATPRTSTVRGWTRHEYRHRRRGEPRLETRRGPARACERVALDSYEPERIALPGAWSRRPIRPSRA